MVDKTKEDQLVDEVLGWLQVNVLKLIMTRVIPLIMGSGIALAVLAWLQDEIGLDLDPAVVATFIGTVMAGVVAAVFSYVKNHGGAAYMGRALLQLMELRDAGAATLTNLPGQPDKPKISNPDEPTVPPGLEGGG